MTSQPNNSTHGVSSLIGGAVASGTRALRVQVARSFPILVQLGLIPGVRVFRGMGEKDGTSQTALMEDLCRFSELSNTPAKPSYKTDYKIPRPDAAGTAISMISESAQDSQAGTGARRVEIHYIDTAGAEQVTQVDCHATDGTIEVSTGITNAIFINDFHVIEAGSDGVAAGHMRLYKTGAASQVYTMIAAMGNQAMVSAHMIPAGKTLLMQWWTPSESQGKRCWIRLRSDADNGNGSPPSTNTGVYLFKSSVCLNKTTPGSIPLAYTLSALSVIKTSVLADANGADTSVHWWGYLVDD